MPARVVVIIPRLALLARSTTNARGRAPNTALALAACILVVVRRRVTRARVPVSIASRHRRPTTTSPATTRSMDGHRGPIAREGGDYATGHDRLRPIPETDHTPRARANVRAGPSVRVYYIPVRALVVRTTTSYLVVSTWYHDRSVGRSRRSVGRSRRSVGRSRRRRHTRARVDGRTDRPRRSRRSRTPRALDDDDDVSSSTFATDGRSRPGVDRRGRRTRGPTRGVHGEAGDLRDTFVSHNSSRGRRSGWIR